MELVSVINWVCPFPFEGFEGTVMGGLFFFYSNFNIISCKQTVEFLIRSRILAATKSGYGLFVFVPEKGCYAYMSQTVRATPSCLQKRRFSLFVLILNIPVNNSSVMSGVILSTYIDPILSRSSKRREFSRKIFFPLLNVNICCGNSKTRLF